MRSSSSKSSSCRRQMRSCRRRLPISIHLKVSELGGLSLVLQSIEICCHDAFVSLSIFTHSSAHVRVFLHTSTCTRAHTDCYSAGQTAGPRLHRETPRQTATEIERMLEDSSIVHLHELRLQSWTEITAIQ